MPSDNELYLWWSGSSESVFLYYLTGAMIISFLATILITKSLRRDKSRVIELLHEDDGRDILVTYLLKVTTSIMPGSGCPTVLKIFMQLKGENETSEFFQLRSKPCGKALFQRGQTDIFIVNVPGKIGDVKSAELLVSGLKGQLPWKIEDVQLYNPVSRVKKYFPVMLTALENLNFKSEKIFSVPTTSWKFWIIRNLLRYHQWMAMFGNSVRIGAFTEIAHVLCVFMALFCLMILSQIFYIILPRGEFIPSPDDGQDRDDEVDPGMFNINIKSLVCVSVVTSVSCFVLILGLEILLRNVKSLEQDPGNAYYTVCRNKTNKFESHDNTNINLHDYKASAFFLPSCDFFDNHFGNFVDGKPDTAEHHPEYVLLLVEFLRKEYEKYSLEVSKKNDDQENFNEVPSTSELPQWVMTRSEVEQMSEENDSQGTLHEIELAQQTSANLSQLLSTFDQESDQWSYFDHMKNRRASQVFANDESYSDLEQVVIEFPKYNDSKIHMFIHRELDESKAQEDLETDKNVDSDVSKENLNKSKKSTTNILEDTERLMEGISPANRELNELKLKNSVSEAWHDECVQKNLDHDIVLDWENLLKTWSRELVKDFCDIIKSVRESLILNKLDVSEITLILLKNVQDVLQRLVIACYMQCSKTLYDALKTDEATKLLTHLSMEIMVTALQEIFVMLMKKGNVCLVDLILRSHRIMHMLQYATRILRHALTNDLNVFEYIRCLNLAHSMHQLLTVILHGCFDLVTTYNFVPWRSLKTLVERKLKDHLEETCYRDLLRYVQFNIQNSTMEDIAVKRLCMSVEEHAKQEIWEDLHNEKKFFTNALIKCQIMNTLNLKISKLRKQKQNFDQDYDLLPKVPKTRVQLLAEKRKPKAEDETMKQTLAECGNHAKSTENLDKINQNQFEKLEKQSKELGQTIDNLCIIRDRLKKVLSKQGLTKKLDSANLLSQALLHPCVKNLHGDTDSIEEQTATGMYKFANFLQFKRTETALTHFFQDTANELIQYLLKTALSQFDLKSLSEIEMEQVVQDILVKLDTLVDFFYEDLDNIMRQCVRTEQSSDKSKNHKIDAAVKCSALSLIEKSSLIHWSTLDLSHITASEMSILQSEFNEFDKFELEEILQYIKEEATQEKEKEIDLNENAVITVEDTEDKIEIDAPVHTDDMEINVVDETHKKTNNFTDREEEDGEIVDLHTPTYSLQDMIKDLWPVKRVLELMKQEEEVRSDVTMIRYINRSKRIREQLCTLELDNIVDAYHMLDEGDDSHTLTSAGLYQLEHDCMSEDLKPLPPWVKMMALTLIVILLILITVYVTVIGGQFSTTDLQEWMCYYLLSILFFVCVLEPIRACIVGWCMTIVEHKLNCNKANQAKFNVKC